MDPQTQIILKFAKTANVGMIPIFHYLGIKIKKYSNLNKYQDAVFDSLYSYFTNNPDKFPSPKYKYILNKPCHQIDPNILYSIMTFLRQRYYTLSDYDLWYSTDNFGQFSPSISYKTINKNLTSEFVLPLAFIDLDLFKTLENLVWVIDPQDELEDSSIMNYCNPQDTNLSVHKPLAIGGDCDLVGTFLCSFWEKEKYHDLAKPHGIEWARQNKRQNPTDCTDFTDDVQDSDKTYCKKIIKAHPEFKPVQQIQLADTFRTIIPLNERFCLNADNICPLSQIELQHLDEDKIVQTSSNYCYSAEDFANYLYHSDFANKDPVDPNLLIYEDFKTMREKLFRTGISHQIINDIDDKIEQINIQRPANISALLDRLPDSLYEIISVANICMSDMDDIKGFPDANKALTYLYTLMDTLTTVEIQSIASSDGITLETFRNMVENGYCIHRAGMLLFSIVMFALYGLKKVYPNKPITLPTTFYLDNDKAVTFHLDTHNKNETLIPVGVDCLFSNNNRHFPGTYIYGRVFTNSIYDPTFTKYTNTIPNHFDIVWKEYYNTTKQLILRK